MAKKPAKRNRRRPHGDPALMDARRKKALLKQITAAERDVVRLGIRWRAAMAKANAMMTQIAEEIAAERGLILAPRPALEAEPERAYARA